MGIWKNTKIAWKYVTGGWTIPALRRAADEELRERMDGDFRAYTGEDYRMDLMIRTLTGRDSRDTLRDVFDFRLKSLPGHKFKKWVYNHAFPNHPGILIEEGDVGPGLRVYHNYCTIGFDRAGKNLTVFQGVTCGNRGVPGLPIVEDDVMIGANAVLLGHIHIGNRVKIGAGAVVLTDVPDDCIVVGNPGRILPRKEVR